MKQGIRLHKINTGKYKTNLIAIFLSTPLTRENVTKNTVLSAVLRRGSQKYKSQEEISKKLEEMYGAECNSGIDKFGKNHVLKFYIEAVNDEYLPQNGENMLKQSLEMLSEMAFNPLVENGQFKEEYVKQEIENIKQVIEAKKDNKARYAIFRCKEEMFKGEPEGLYKYGYVEDLENINAKNLYEYYKKLLNECKIDIIISGKLDCIDVEKIIEEDENIQKLQERNPIYIINEPSIKRETSEENIIEEKMEVTQGKLVIGYDVCMNEEMVNNIKTRYIGMLYNSILGGTANSKMFQNVREKESLAYTANSSYMYYACAIFVTAGIEIKNYNKALDIIKLQIEAMKKGDFSEEDITNAKNVIISGIKTTRDEQDSEIIYKFVQALSKKEISLNEYEEYIKNVNKEEIVDFAQNIKLNTIYFLRN